MELYVPQPQHPKDIFFFPKGAGFNGRRVNRYLEEILNEHFDEWLTRANKKLYVKNHIVPKIRNAYYGSGSSARKVESKEEIAILLSNKFHYYKRLKKNTGEIPSFAPNLKPSPGITHGTLQTL